MEQENGQLGFLLVPILETVFSGDVKWRPDWPADVPPDAFLAENNGIKPAIIELYRAGRNYSIRRDREGRLIEFPHFSPEGNSMIHISYSSEGALQGMSVTLEESSDIIMDITFPSGFLPYSDLSPGGSFPPIIVNNGSSDFYVYIFESPRFLTETWYDSYGNLLMFSKAVTIVEKDTWKVRSLQIHDSSGINFIDYSFDSYGNITEIQNKHDTYSAYYRGSRPDYWGWYGFRYEFQWDTRGILSIIRVLGENYGLAVEYRYEYEIDFRGNWVSRRETAYIIQFDLLVPHPASSRGNWNRRIIF